MFWIGMYSTVVIYNFLKKKNYRSLKDCVIFVKSMRDRIS